MTQEQQEPEAGVADLMAFHKRCPDTTKGEDMTEQEHHGQNEYPRVRINVKQLAKGELRFDSTYEDVGRPWQEVLVESDAMIAALVERYPAPEA